MSAAEQRYVFSHLEIRHSACPLALRQASDRTGWAGLQGKGGGGWGTFGLSFEGFNRRAPGE